MKRFTPLNFFLRVAFAIVLVLVTINPSGYSYYHWLKEAVGLGEFGALHALLGLVLLIGWVIFVRATGRSLGIFGVILAVAVCGALVWLMVDTQVIRLEESDALSWVILIAVGVVLGVGMSWSHIRRRLTGQLDVDDVESGG